MPLALTDRNLFIHTRAEALPYQGTTLAIHVARLVSLLFGAGALIATMTGASAHAFPRRGPKCGPALPPSCIPCPSSISSPPWSATIAP